MLKSMTGYGSASAEVEGTRISVEIKSLNSKFLDLGIRVPRAFSEKEITLRSQLSSLLERGKINLNIEMESTNGLTMRRTLNKPLFLEYIREVQSVARLATMDGSMALPAILALPDVMQNPPQSDTSTLWESVEKVMDQALDEFEAFRIREGKTLAHELTSYITKIQDAHERIIALKDERMVKIKDSLREKLADIIAENKLDQNRFEQELIYYSDKLDITEEVVRLKSHIDLFLSSFEEDSPGKKLGFVVQEMGREINTTGAKANDAEILKNVVIMKEELEKIKEQSFNIL